MRDWCRPPDGVLRRPAGLVLAAQRLFPLQVVDHGRPVALGARVHHVGGRQSVPVVLQEGKAGGEPPQFSSLPEEAR